MEFITIDFETANFRRDSPCEVGLTFVQDGIIKETRSWLIRPINNEFHGFNIGIHGIRPEDVEDSPEFDQVWSEILPLVNGKFLIAHNAAFDMSVLRNTLLSYSLDYPELLYSCSYTFSKRVWPSLPSYGLKQLCSFIEIDLQHHRAAADSRATAELCLKAFEMMGVKSHEDFPEIFKMNLGRLFPGGYRPSETRKYDKGKPGLKPVGDPSKFRPDNIFYESKVVFTGKMGSMTRDQAHQLIVDIGGVIGSTVTPETDFLVVGQQDYRFVGDDGMSNKQEKAMQLISKGSELEILSEDEFLRLI